MSRQARKLRISGNGHSWFIECWSLDGERLLDMNGPYRTHKDAIEARTYLLSQEPRDRAF